MKPEIKATKAIKVTLEKRVTKVTPETKVTKVTPELKAIKAIRVILEKKAKPEIHLISEQTVTGG